MKAYFPKLDKLRFFAFLIVFISHTFFFLFDVQQSDSAWLKTYGSKVFGNGEVGVHIFFTLSGFLIMFLALKELKKTQDFSIRSFFKRRILRIWPLYFIVLSVGFIVSKIPSVAESCYSKFWYFLGNVCAAENITITGIETSTIVPLWSISVEEQFYVLFPFLFMYGVWTMRKGFLFRRAMLAIVSCVLLVFSLSLRYINAENWLYISYATVSVLPSLLIGMLFALFINKEHSALIRLVFKKSKASFGVGILLFLLSLYIKYQGSLGISLYILPLCVSTCIFISLAIKDRQHVDRFENHKEKLTVYLGKISYGLYVYHMFMILLVNKIFDSMAGSMTDMALVAVKAITVLILTIGISHISYKYVEKWFLSFK